MKTSDVLDDFRRRIVSGEFACGSQIPLRSALAADYASSLDTLQKVIHTLRSEGFLENCGSNGTRIHPYPPHLYRIGIVFPVMEDQNSIRDTFFKSFELAVAECVQSKQLPYRFEFYRGIEHHTPDPGEFQRLSEDIHCGRLAGLVVLEHRKLSPEMSQLLATLPTVFFSELNFVQENVTNLKMDYFQLLELACEELEEAGCSNPAVLANTGHLVKYVPEWQAVFEAHQMNIPDKQIQGLCLCHDALPWYRQLFQLLFETPNPPDSLIVLNENILPFLLDSLRGMPEPLKVISHCNFPLSQQLDYPISRIGIDTREALKLAIRQINSRIHHAPKRSYTLQMVRASELTKHFNWI